MCSSELIFLDHDTGERITLQDNDLEIVERNITFTTEQLRVNRRYDVTIQARNSYGRDKSYFSISEDFVLLLCIY